MLNVLREKYVYIMSIPYAEAALRGALMKRRPEKYVANPQENTHTEVRPQQIRRAALLKSHSNAGAPHKSTAQIFENTLPQEHP